MSGVAYHLEQSFRARGITCSRVTADSLRVSLTDGAAQGRAGDALKALEVVLFTLAATPKAWWARRRGKIVIVHNDALGGSIYVNHGLHRALMAVRPLRSIFKNPLNLFIAARESIRFRWGLYGRIVCLSDSESIRLRRFYAVERELIHVIPNGVDLQAFGINHPGSLNRTRRTSGGDNRLVATFIGHEFERKGLPSIFKALGLPEGNDVSLRVIGGSSNEINRYEAVAARMGLIDRVEFLGVRDDVVELLHQTDVLVMMSDIEAFPLVGLEAMASGVPCLFSPGAAVGGYVDDDVNGCVVGSPQQLAAAFARLREDPDLLQRLSLAATTTAASYDWSKIAAMYEALASTAGVKAATVERPLSSAEFINDKEM